MPSLHDLQRAFSATVFGDASAAASLGVVAGGLTPEARIGIYRANVLGNYRKVLAATYPVIKRLVGAPFFDAASDNFVRAHPSTRGDVNGYGADFAAFLRGYSPAGDLAYLPDVARLEWAVDQAGIARDAAAFDPAALADVPPNLHAELRFSLHPSVRLIVSMFPILHIWRANQPDADPDERVELDEGGDTLLVQRRSSNAAGIVIERIAPPDQQLLALLAAGHTLGQTAADCTSRFPEFDLADALRRHVTGETIVAFRAPSCQS